MARGELMKKLLASYGRDDEFRAVAEQIIDEEEKKNNRVLARSLRKTLEAGPSGAAAPKALAPLIPFPEAAADFIERAEPRHTRNEIILGATNVRVLLSLVKEFRRAEQSAVTASKYDQNSCSAARPVAGKRYAPKSSPANWGCRSSS